MVVLVGVSRFLLFTVVGVVAWMGTTLGGGWKLARAATSSAVLASASQERYRPPRLAPLVRPALPGEGVWRSTEPPVRGGPPVLVTTFRPDPSSPGIVAYLAWFDHLRTQQSSTTRV